MVCGGGRLERYYCIYVYIYKYKYVLYNPLWEYKQGHSFRSYIVNILLYTYALLPPADIVYSITLLVPNTATGATSH